MDMQYYGLDGQPISQTEGWALMENGEARRVAHTVISDHVTVSTVFLVIDHGFTDGPPILYETMIFGGPHDNDQWRYPTRAAAIAGHDQAAALARDAHA